MSNCTANLTAGFVDLATYDELEKYMYGGKDATAYFVRETRKSTWFTQCPVTLSKSAGNPEFGAEWSCTISRAGDYLLGTWLHVVTPQVEVADGSSVALAWSPNFMHALVKECCITFNDLVAARFDGTHLDFWAAFTTPASKANGYSRMIGATLPSMGGVLAPQSLNLPLPFFYARDSGVALPTAALPYNEMRINFKFRDWREMLLAFNNAQVGDNTDCVEANKAIPSDGTTADNVVNQLAGGAGGALAGRVPIANVNLKKEPSLGSNAVQVWANYAIVSNEERSRMACAPRDILIEQVQSMPTYLVNQRYAMDVAVNGANATVQNNSQSQMVNADIRFSHAIKVLFFAAKNLSNQGVHSNYTTGIPVLKAGVGEEVCVANCGLGGRAFANPEPATPADPKYSEVAGSKVYGSMQGQACLSLGCCNAKDPLSRASLVYENTNRLGLMGSDYYSLVQPYYHAPAVPSATPHMSSTWCQSGLHMYSYSLDFMCLDPLGSTNYGKLTNVQINAETENDLGACGGGAVSLVNGENNNLFNMSHSSMVETLYLTGNCSQSNLGSLEVGQSVQGGYCDVPYQLVLTAVNNNIIRISGGALGFPVL